MSRKRFFWSFATALAVSATACGDNVPYFEEPVVESEIYNPDHTAARNWNEALLASIRRDFARPTVHARNLFHSSAMMYDLWAAYDEEASPYFLGKTVNGVGCEFSQADRMSLIGTEGDKNELRSLAIGYAMHTLLRHRFQNSPGSEYQLDLFDDLLTVSGLDQSFVSRDFREGSEQERAGALGLYLADCVIAYGAEDGANEVDDYANLNYSPINPPLEPDKSGNPDIVDPDHWQPLELELSIDQAGNVTENQPAFVGAEWGKVWPFAIPDSACEVRTRDGEDWTVCNDEGPPALLRGDDALPSEYQWNHSMVVYWSSHLDPEDGVMWDISPATIGNSGALPTDIPGLQSYYNALDGGATDSGHPMNPATGQPYAPNMVPRGDYTRVLAEFWADGPDSETPPGHWFTIVNEIVNDHPELQKKYQGQGEVLDDLEWEVKLYFVLGGGLHDAAVSAWGAKGFYDYVRPISAIRFMASKGQSSDMAKASYDPEGIPLLDGYVELVEAGDPLAGEGDVNIGKIKVRAWRGPDFVDDAAIDLAGVGWILADDWYSYQRPSFVSPPFAGYLSGHSTFSRTAAEILTAFTGDAFFPGGMGTFAAPANKFLVFEEGPSVDIELQWATYRDASDQTSLSRIWGGIHPPVDDVPGRRLGIAIAADVLAVSDALFEGP